MGNLTALEILLAKDVTPIRTVEGFYLRRACPLICRLDRCDHAIKLVGEVTS